MTRLHSVWSPLETRPRRVQAASWMAELGPVQRPRWREGRRGSEPGSQPRGGGGQGVAPGARFFALQGRQPDGSATRTPQTLTIRPTGQGGREQGPVGREHHLGPNQPH